MKKLTSALFLSNRFWGISFGAAFLLALAACFFVWHGAAGGTTAQVYINGELAYEVDLEAIGEPYTFAPQAGNIIRVESGRICIESADCPDQICVRQGWIAGGGIPIVCLPNRLVIRIEAASRAFDAISK